MKTLFLVIGLSIFLTACGAAGTNPGGGASNAGTSTAVGGSKLDVRAGGKDSTLNVKSGGASFSGMNYSIPGKPATKASIHTIHIANYELDGKAPATVLTTPDQMRVDIRIIGEEGTWDTSPFKVGTYDPKAELFNKVSNITIVTFADGKQVETRFDNSSSNKKIDGDVKITSVTADTVSGEVNLTEGDKSVKGPFTVKLPLKK